MPTLAAETRGPRFSDPLHAVRDSALFHAIVPAVPPRARARPRRGRPSAPREHRPGERSQRPRTKCPRPARAESSGNDYGLLTRPAARETLSRTVAITARELGFHGSEQITTVTCTDLPHSLAGAPTRVVSTNVTISSPLESCTGRRDSGKRPLPRESFSVRFTIALRVSSLYPFDVRAIRFASNAS